MSTLYFQEGATIAMSNFEVGEGPAREPVGMKIVGVGIIVSCLLLSVLFAWGIYLDLTQEPCVRVETQESLGR